MTIIAYDGNIIAADKMMVYYEMPQKTTKLFKENDVIYGFTGLYDAGLILWDWYRCGAEKEKYPQFQQTDDWCRLVVFEAGVLKSFEKNPKAIVYQNDIMAFGSGRDFAIGAMAAGKNAIQAVEIASKYCISCGLGIDYFTVG